MVYINLHISFICYSGNVSLLWVCIVVKSTMLFLSVLGHPLRFLPFQLCRIMLPFLQLFPFMWMMAWLFVIPSLCMPGSFLNFRNRLKSLIWVQYPSTLAIVSRVIVLIRKSGFLSDLTVLSYCGFGIYLIVLRLLRL